MKHQTIQLDKNEVTELFETATDTSDIILALYKMVYGDRWDTIKLLNGFPTCNEHTNLEIMQLFQAFDKRAKADFMLGGLWFNNGFSSCDKHAATLKNYEILPCEDLTYINS